MESLVSDKIKKSRIPAKLDYYQSATGLLLAVFLKIHIILVSSILLGKEVMYHEAKTMEASFLTQNGHGYPFLVTIAALLILTIFIIHAALGIRKFPINWKQHQKLRTHMAMLKHSDTNLWYIQFITGFIMFFLGSAHLIMIASTPDQIGPYASSDRIFSQGIWILYLFLLFAAELHGTIGLYRLAVKWGWFEGKDPGTTRKRLKRLREIIIIIFLTLGLTTLGTYMKIGMNHQDNIGERYTPPATMGDIK
jgi:fumarate reductase subunit C